MTVTLRIWLAGPLQAWGTSSRFETRHTELAPSKSGVVGLVCAALGRARTASVDDLAAMRFGVRIERPGSVLRDFHTVGAGPAEGRIPVASGTGKPRGVVTERFYLQDAAFVAGLESGDRELLDEMLAALVEPRWMLVLGRRSCPPAGPLVDDGALFEGPLEQALSAPWRPRGGAVARSGGGSPTVELLVEDPDGLAEVEDQPTGAAFARRTFAARRARSLHVPRGQDA